MAKSTPLSVEQGLTRSVQAFYDRAHAIKVDADVERQRIRDDEMTTDVGKRPQLDALREATRAKLDALRAEQDEYVATLRSKVERELAGYQSTDASSVLLRRDAADRARKIGDESEALAVLNDAIRDGDESLAHAVGVKARKSGWVDAGETWQNAYPASAGSLEALAFIDDATTSPAYNIANSIAYSLPE